MKKEWLRCKQISFLLVMCMMVALCIPIVSAEIVYKTNYTGDTNFTISGSSGATVTYESGKDGVGGKASDDKVYYYSSPDANTGYGYFSTKASVDDSKHDADSSVVEFSFLLEDENSAFYFSPAFYNKTGYDYFVENGKLITTSGKGYFKSHNDFLRFNAKGVYITKTTDGYVDSAYANKLLSDKPLEVGVWHTVAIKLPGLINSEGTPAREVNVAIDGAEYTIPTNCDIYGTRHIKLHGIGSMYLDNINMYMTNQLESPSDYKNSAKLPEINIAGTGAKLKDGKISVGGSLTVSQLKSMIKGSDAVRVYTDSSYNTLAADSDILKSGNRVVVAAKNGYGIERSYAYYPVAEQKPLEVKEISLTDAEGKVIEGYKLSDTITISECFVNTTITNNTRSNTEPIRVVVASYDEDGAMVYYKSKELVVSPGELNISSAENVHKFENIPVMVKGKLKAFILYSGTGEPLCDKFETAFGSDKEYHILAIGNSYSGNSFTYLPRIAAADGIEIYAVNMYIGGCPISTHYSRMKGTGTYEKRNEYFPDGTTNTTEKVTFDEGLFTPGYAWDYITLHQKGQYSPFYENYYTESKPYITELANYIRTNVPNAEVLFFENWPVYTDRVTEKYDVYESIVAEHEPEEYMDLVFAEIKNCYIKAAEQIDNPGRIIPAGEAVYRAVKKYGFAEYVKNESTGNFVGSARAMFTDESSHMTNPYGCVLAGLVWYEYLTGNDARENKFTYSKIPADDMKLLKEIAHEVCSLPEYNPNTR